MIKFLRLPIKWDVTSPEVIHNAEIAGIEYEPEFQDDYIDVVPEHIAYICASADPENCAIGINGECKRINLTRKELYTKIKEFYAVPAIH